MPTRYAATASAAGGLLLVGGLLLEHLTSDVAAVGPAADGAPAPRTALRVLEPVGAGGGGLGALRSAVSAHAGALATAGAIAACECEAGDGEQGAAASEGGSGGHAVTFWGVVEAGLAALGLWEARTRLTKIVMTTATVPVSRSRAASRSGITERTTSQNAGLWFISRRWASSCTTT